MDAWEDQHSREATESARKRADELGIDIAVVDGTGSNGRVTRDDVEAHAENHAHRGGEVDGDAVFPSEPGEDIVPPEQVPDDTPEVEVTITGEGDCVRFHCPTNPNFNLRSHKLGRTIRFAEGCYETSDPAEIAALRAQQCVEEVRA